MSRSVSRRDEAIGVECAWPVREVNTADRHCLQPDAGKLRKHRWRALAMVAVIGLLAIGGWSLKDSAIEIGTAVPSGVPTQTE